ncbi:MAG: glycosyltransferase [Verrucomicrobia bacterium]|nr:glycosyltransferase [Verrucomicrobiota bacterium]
MKAIEKQLRIAAVFATMNRSDTAAACVRALAAQTRPPEWVVVADNVSDDDTVARLEGLEDLPFRLIVHRMVRNRGNAGGVEEAMDLAFGLGADAVWILDDDSWPRPDALEVLSDGVWDSRVVRHSLQVDPKTGKFTWPLQVADADGGWRLAWQMDDLPGGERLVTRGMWTGALVSKEVRDEVGPVNGELFIRGEDEEYPWRIEKAGFSFEGWQGAVLDHPGPVDLVKWSIFGKHLFFERGLADWKLYYKVRNMVWLKRMQHGGVGAVKMAAAYAAAVASFDGVKRLPLVWCAVRDGWNGRLGKWQGQVGPSR